MTIQTHDFREETFSVASFESDFTGRLTLYSLFDRFQDIAGLHASHLEVGFDKLRESGLAWMLSRIKVKINSPPKWGEAVTLRTWPKGVDRLFALRDFHLRDADGRILALATTCWLLVDIEKGKPRRLESLNIDLKFPGAGHAIPEVPEKIQAPEQLIPVYDKQILSSELDVNEHVNNAHYVRWIVDCFDVTRLRSNAIGTIQLNYLDQALYGDSVGISMSRDSDMENAHYVEGISKKRGTRVFQALVEWQ